MTQGEYIRRIYGYYLRSADQWTHTRFLGAIISNLLAKEPKLPSELMPLFLDEMYKTDEDRLFEEQQLLNALPKA